MAAGGPRGPRWMTKSEITHAYGRQLPIKYVGKLNDMLLSWHRQDLLRRRELTSPSSLQRLRQAAERGVRLTNCKYEYNATDLSVLMWQYFSIHC